MSVFVSAREAFPLQKLELLNFQQKLTPSPGATNIHFGAAIAVSASTLAVGAPSPMSLTENAGGSVVVFARTNSVWTATETLLEPESVYGDGFGNSVALAGDILVVGAPRAKSTGRVYVFTRAESGWTLTQELKPSDGSVTWFGRSVALDANALAIGSQGAAFIFKQSNGNWSEQQKLQPAAIQASDDFGCSIGLDQNSLAIGASGRSTPSGTSAGSVFIYATTNSNWTLQQELTGETITVSAYDQFGTALAISGDTLIVGAPSDDVDYGQDGSAFVFTRTEGKWDFRQKLRACAPAQDAMFGNSMALNGDTLVVGVLGQVQTGVPCLFVRTDGIWQQHLPMPAGDVVTGDEYGSAVASDGENIVIAAPRKDSRTGAVYTFGPVYDNEVKSTQYVRRFLYTPDASASPHFDPTIAAFRYKELLYARENGKPRSQVDRLEEIFGEAERNRSHFAEQELNKALELNPESSALGNLLLDIYYDRAVPDFVFSGNLLTEVERSRLGPPSVPTGFVIDDEINLKLDPALELTRKALADYFALLETEAGGRIFKALTASRGLEPAQYLSNGIPVSVATQAEPLFVGYKDLVLLFQGLRDYGRTAHTLAVLRTARKDAGDLEKARELLTEAQQFLFLHASVLRGMFPGLNPDDPQLQGSGLREAIEGTKESQLGLQTLEQSITGNANLLGFESDFLMLVQKFPGQSGDIFDSFDALQLRLNPTDLSSPLSYAIELLNEARDSFAEYRGFQDQLETQLANVNRSAENRLFQIVGARPGTTAYETPEANDGSEIWQQYKSIEVARLRIQKNNTEMSNLEEEIQIEINRAASISNAVINFGDRQASLTEQIGKFKAAQAAANAVATVDMTTPTFLVAGNAVFQAYAEVKKSILEGEKEQLAAQEKAELEGIESKARVQTLLLGMRTLAIDSQEAVLLMKQEMGRLTALHREKGDLERVIAESQENLSGRYFADPVHRLRYQHQSMLANSSFDEAQKWLYFMARALEYKWNTPFTNYFYLGRRWATPTLFKLHNAEELREIYNAMASFNSLVQLPRDDYFDWFSVRDDFFGYKLTNELGAVVYYPDPSNLNGPVNLTGIQAFRRKLSGLTNTQGTIRIEFSTAREIPGGTFFRGARFDNNGRALSAGLFLDKIKWMKINLPGNHTLGRSQLAGELTYAGTSWIRNFDVGTFAPDHPNYLVGELSAYSTRYWFFHPPSAAWRFSEALSSPVTMQLNTDPRVPPSVQEIDVFKERSVATTGWALTIPTQDLGVRVLNIDELNDVELYFYHYAVSRQMPEGSVTSARSGIPFPYYLKHQRFSQ